ncbi:MAG: TRAP transporter substrate-binding protein [Alphaproteobacteria bacterium]|nr:TRAP transporter substrate-binding protein [Alphaproteobacteria bacterium]
MPDDQSQNIQRRDILNFAAAAGTAALAAPHVARAQSPIVWRMATSWQKNLPGPGISAERLAQRINAMSAGRMRVDVFAAGTLAPAFGVLEAVSTGAAQMGHTATFFWDGALPGAAFFTTAPFGLGPLAHQTWIEHGGGQQLWDELYRPRGVFGRLAGNTGPSMGGWFRKPIEKLDDIRGMRIRVAGMGGEVYAALGAVPQNIPPGDIFAALEKGTIDAVELLAPVNDLPLGFQRYAPFYYMPGFNKPNGAGEAMISLAAFEKLPEDLRAVVENACQAEHAAALAEADAQNAKGIVELVGKGARVSAFPAEVMKAAREKSREVINAKAAKSELAARIVASWRTALRSGDAWTRIQAYSEQALRTP